MPAQPLAGRGYLGIKSDSGVAMLGEPSAFEQDEIDHPTGNTDSPLRPARVTPPVARPSGVQSEQPAPEEGRWLSIDAACKLLGVDQSTLRRWSDSGKIPVFRTPGGHRRYSEDDLRALVRGEQRRRRVSRSALTTRSMSAYEHDYLHQARLRPWYRAYDAGMLDELRPLGRRMVDL